MPPKAAPTAVAPKSRLGRGLSSLIKVSMPSPVEVGAESAGRAGAERGGDRGGDRGAEAGRMLGAPAAADSAIGLGQRESGSDRPAEGETTVAAVPDGRPLMIPVARIRPNPHQPRRTFTDANLRELADSIRANGVIQPLVVRWVAAGGGGGAGASTAQYELIAGERRLRASQLAGLTEVPCHVKDVDVLTQAQMALVENIQREDLNPLERAEGYRALMVQLGLTQQELAGRVGEDRSSIANYLRLLSLAEPVKQMLKQGLISLGHAKLLAGVEDVLHQERLARLVLSQGLSVRNLEKAILNAGPDAGLGGGAVQPPAAAVADPSVKAGREAHYQELEKHLTHELGLRVQISAGKGKGKGKLTLHYSTLDQFDRLMEKLGVELG